MRLGSPTTVDRRADVLDNGDDHNFDLVPLTSILSGSVNHIPDDSECLIDDNGKKDERATHVINADDNSNNLLLDNLNTTMYSDGATEEFGVESIRSIKNRDDRLDNNEDNNNEISAENDESGCLDNNVNSLSLNSKDQSSMLRKNEMMLNNDDATKLDKNNDQNFHTNNQQTISRLRSVSFHLPQQQNLEEAEAVPIEPAELMEPKELRRRSKSCLDISTGRIVSKQSTATCIAIEEARKRGTLLQKVRERLKDFKLESSKLFDDTTDGLDPNAHVESEKMPRVEMASSKCFRVRSAKATLCDHEQALSKWKRRFSIPFTGPILQFACTNYQKIQINAHLRWIFRASFYSVFVWLFLQFIFLAIIFSCLILLAAKNQPQCVSVGTIDMQENGYGFVDAFQLSWTTLAAVGFGAVAPTPSTEYSRCIGINMLMAFESFVGLLFSSVAGAMVFAKIARTGNVAHVRFSYPLCVRYGPGVSDHKQKSDDEDSSSSFDEEYDTKFPCPLLEFRILNEMSNETGGEIVNATVHVVASTEALAEEDVASQRESNKRFKSDALGSKKVAEATKNLASATTKAATRITDAVKTATTRGHPMRLAKYGNIVLKLNELKKADISGKERVSTEVGREPSQVEIRSSSGENALNEMSDETVGEIVDTAVNVVASATTKAETDITDAVNVPATNGHQMRLAKYGSIILKLNRRKSIFLSKDSFSTEGTSPDETVERESEIVSQLSTVDDELSKTTEAYRMSNSIHNEGRAKFPHSSITLDEGDPILAAPRVYHKLHIETDTHPFFKRIWSIVHVLNASSPLLSREARRAIERNDGFWPSEWNNPASIREHVKFKQIIVSFSGISSASGSTVYSRSVFEYEQLCIGFMFVSVLYTENGKINVDPELINDVRPQNGGGAESWDYARRCPFGESKETMLDEENNTGETKQKRKSSSKFRPGGIFF